MRRLREIRVASGRTPTPSDPVHGAEESGDESRTWLEVKLLRRARLLERPLCINGDLVRSARALLPGRA